MDWPGQTMFFLPLAFVLFDTVEWGHGGQGDDGEPVEPEVVTQLGRECDLHLVTILPGLLIRTVPGSKFSRSLVSFNWAGTTIEWPNDEDVDTRRSVGSRCPLGQSEGVGQAVTYCVCHVTGGTRQRTCDDQLPEPIAAAAAVERWS